MTSTAPQTVDYRSLFKKVEAFVDEIERSEDAVYTIAELAEGIVSHFREELGIYGGRLYRRQGQEYVLEATICGAKQVPEGTRVPASYPPLVKVLAERTVFMRGDDAQVDQSLEEMLGVKDFAAIEVANGEYVLAFNLKPEALEQETRYSLGILRHAINQKVGRERISSIFDEAKRIQASILPKSAPQFGPYDIYGRSVSMETVGGDFFDFLPMTQKSLGLAIADVSGHGLPAALQVRDIYTGLRMGMERDFKIVRTVERLNGIIHESTLTSRFVSMFYGELGVKGLFIYVNAGHPPPFILRANGELFLLEEGGPILGPIAGASYDRGFATLKPGDVLVLFTDGITETGSARNPIDEYGVERLQDLVREHQARTAEEIVDEIFKDLTRHCVGCPPQDDRTVVVIKYPS